MRNLIGEDSKFKILSNVIVFIMALIGLAQQNFKLNQVSFFEGFLIETLAPLQQGTLSVKERVSSFFEHYIFIINTSKKNEELTEQLALYKNQVFTLQQIKKENERLKSLLEFGEEIPRKKVLAQVVGWDSSNEFRVLRINKGKKHGLKLKAPVITMDGLVGYVYRMTENYSDILTILDQNNRVPAIISNTRSKGVVEGTTGFKCQLKYIIRTDDIKEGEVVVTAEIGEMYPKNIKIGTITKIIKESWGITQYIEITPSVDFGKLEEVLVLLPGSNINKSMIKKEDSEVRSE